MSKFGGLHDKIRVINVIKNVLDIQTANPIEIDIKFEDNPAKEQFISIANRLQRIPFIYESINRDLSNTILLRNLLYNPALYPIIIQKRDCKTSECIYTRTPIKKNVVDNKFHLSSLPPEEPLYVIGLVINTSKQGTILIDNIKSSHIVPEYLDDFETRGVYKIIYFTENNVTDLLLALIRQLRYTVRFYNSTIYSYTFEEFLEKNIIGTEKPKTDLVKIDNWYSKKETDYLKFLLSNKREWVYNLDPIQILGNDIDQLLFILTEGPKSKHVKEYFVLQEMERNKMKELQRIEKETLKFVNMARQYIIIIGKKLGSNVQQKVLLAMSRGRYLRLPGGSMAIPTMSTNINNPTAILEHLTKEQQQVVKIEYDRQEKFMKAFYANKCEHLSVYRKLIRAKNVNDTKLALDAVTKYFKKELSNGFHICESCGFHIMCSHVYDRYKYQIDNLPLGTINTNLLTYAIKVKVNKGHEYYCKYCGEQLVRDLFIDDEYKIKPKFTMSETDMEIRNYSWSVIMTAIHSAGLGNERSLAIYIANTIRPLIEEMARNKFDNSVKMSCIMHTFAFILSLMKDHKVSFLGIDPSSPASKIAEKLLSFIYSKYNTVMRSLNINTDILKNEFMSAYKNIITTGPTIIPASNSEIDLSNFILNIDPIYKYAKNMCRLFKKIPFKVDKSPQVLRKEFELILGTSLPAIVKSAKENMKNPLFSDILNKRFGSTLQTDTLDFFYRNSDLNIYNNLVSIDDENKILRKFLEGGYEYYIFACYIMFCKYTKNVHNEEEYLEFRELFNQFKIVEDKMLAEIHKFAQKPIFTFKYTKNSHFVERHINITELYDETGTKHKWSVFYYGSESFTKVPGPKKGPLTDVGCSVCGVKKSEINKLNIEKTTKAVKAMSDINSFYMFYKVRCPVNDLHDWINDSCTKCNITVAMIDQVNANKMDSKVLEYYNQHLKHFIQEKKESKPEIKVSKEKEIKLENMITTKWEPNYTPIVKVSQLTKYTTNVIESIGLTEGRTYKEIEEGINIPEIEMCYIYSAYSELLFVISKFMELVTKDKLDLKIIDYTNLFDRLLYEQPYIDTHKFIIQSICEIMLLLPSKNAIEIFSTIIKNQKMFAIPVISVAVDDSDDIIYLGDDIGDSGEDLVVMQKVEDNYFASANIDYDFTEDNPNNELNIDIPKEYIYD